MLGLCGFDTSWQLDVSFFFGSETETVTVEMHRARCHLKNTVDENCLCSKGVQKALLADKQYINILITHTSIYRITELLFLFQEMAPLDSVQSKVLDQSTEYCAEYWS